MSAVKLLLLERLDRGLPPGTDLSEKRRFQRLPFAVLPFAAVTPTNSNIVSVFERFTLDQLYLLLGLDYLLTKEIDVLNLSIGLVGKTFDENHPLQIATRFASELGISVVVAAGNGGPESGTLQPLAQAPWVIAVGATDVEGRLLESSSRGVPNGAKPTVVADGTLPEIDPRFPEPSTSFATPKVTQLVAWIGKCLTLLVSDLADQYNDQWAPFSRPVRLPIKGIADTGFDPKKVRPMAPMPLDLLESGTDYVKVSRSNRERDWFAELLRRTSAHGAYIEGAANPVTIKRCLQLAARPLSNYAPHEMGAGYVSFDEVSKFFKDFIPSRFIDGLCPEVRALLPADEIESLDKLLGPLWESNKCDALIELFTGGIRVVHCKVM